MTMVCADGPDAQCSGSEVLGVDSGIALSRSGVHAMGRSTSDLGAVNPDVTTAFGLQLTSTGTPELRVRKGADAVPVHAAFLLSGFGLTWNGSTERPLLIETFDPTAGRVQLDGSGALVGSALPPSNDLTFYDYATLGPAANMGAYANNRYFPRAEPPRCVPGGVCSSIETSGLAYLAGDWRGGGVGPDRLAGTRLHEDGDIHAGEGLPDANGNRTWLPGGTGFGVPMPGSKGYRTLQHWSYRYGNLAAWFSQDTVYIVDWGGNNEHNTHRRGLTAYGDTTDPAAVPTVGSASYAGIVRGHYAAVSSEPAVPFAGAVTVTVDFATRAVTVSITDTVTDNAGRTPLPLAMTATATLGSGAEANHLRGTVASAGPAANLAGGIGGRLFGPVDAAAAASAPAEIGGVLSLSSAGGETALLVGFVARGQ